MISSIALALISLFVLGLYSALERAFQCYNRLKVEVDKKQEKKYAERVDDLSESKGELLSSFKVAKGLFLLIFGLSVALVLDPLLSRHLMVSRGWIMIIEIVSVTLLVLVVAELIPYAISTMNPNSVLEKFYWFADISKKVFLPFVRNILKNERVVNSSSDMVTTQSQEREASNEITLFQNALNFSEVILRECMVPRTEICAVEEQAAYEELLAQFAESNYSRIIVYRENIDRIIGYIHSKDLFNGKKPVKDLIRAIDFLPETSSAQSLLALMTKSKRSIAVVLDEYGGTAGIVTLEDLIEEIFGEISDELDKEEFIEKKISEKEFLFSARIEIKYLNRTYDLDLPESEDYETLAGLITFFHESIPSEGEVLEIANFYFTILQTASNRVETVALRLVEE